jgi:HEAT repeat protein
MEFEMMITPAATRRRIRRHIEKLGHADDAVSHRAMRYLIRYYGARALGELIEVSGSNNPVVRYRAARTLGHTRDPRAFEPLLRLVEDPAPAVREDARYWFEELGLLTP